MLHLEHGPAAFNCQGMTRRTAIKAGFLGGLGLTLPELLRLQAAGQSKKNKSIILIWLDGGPSHLESYDPKPDAPSEYRGPHGAIKTNVTGVHLSALFPLQAKHADKMVLIRSMHHDTGDHFAGGHWMLTGKLGSTAANLPQMYPSLGSYIARVKGPNRPGLPAYVGLPAAQSIYLFPGYMGSAYLGPASNPFDVNRTQSYLHHSYKIKVGTPERLKNLLGNKDRLKGRVNLVSAFDNLRRETDRTGSIDAMDKYQQQAADMVLGARARAAFDIDREDQRLIDRYGDNPWGRYTLMARRLVEAGVTFASVDMPHWDHHADLAGAHCQNFRVVDRAVSTLLEDLKLRGLLNDTLVMVMGEFGRTPRINKGQPGDSRPGRDHWGQGFSVMLAGGGLKTGQVIGATNAKGEVPVRRAVKPHDLHATVYKWLGIDYTQTFLNHSGRPVAMLEKGKPIGEIL